MMHCGWTVVISEETGKEYKVQRKSILERKSSEEGR
jgi:hypothetical protein